MYLKHSNLTEQIRESLRQIHEYQFKFRTRTVHNKYPSRFLVDQCPTTNVNQFNEHPNSFNEEYSNYLNCLLAPYYVAGKSRLANLSSRRN